MTRTAPRPYPFLPADSDQPLTPNEIKKCYENALRNEPKNLMVHYWFAYYLWVVGRYELSLQASKTALRKGILSILSRCPDQFTTPANLFHRMANAYFGLRKPRQSIECLERAIRLNHDKNLTPLLHYAIAEAYLFRYQLAGKRDHRLLKKVIHFGRKSIAGDWRQMLDGNSLPAQRIRHEVFLFLFGAYLQLGRRGELYKLREAIASEEPQTAISHLLLGMAAVQCGLDQDMHETEQHFREAAKSYGEYGDVRGCTYSKAFCSLIRGVEARWNQNHGLAASCFADAISLFLSMSMERECKTLVVPIMRLNELEGLFQKAWQASSFVQLYEGLYIFDSHAATAFQNVPEVAAPLFGILNGKLACANAVIIVMKLVKRTPESLREGKAGDLKWRRIIEEARQRFRNAKHTPGLVFVSSLEKFILRLCRLADNPRRLAGIEKEDQVSALADVQTALGILQESGIAHDQQMLAGAIGKLAEKVDSLPEQLGAKVDSSKLEIKQAIRASAIRTQVQLAKQTIFAPEPFIASSQDAARDYDKRLENHDSVFTPARIDFCRACMKGRTYAKMAELFSIDITTIEKMRDKLFAELHIHSRDELVSRIKQILGNLKDDFRESHYSFYAKKLNQTVQRNS